MSPGGGRIFDGTIEQMTDFDPCGAAVLLVDDDEDALQLLAIVMEREGYRVLKAINGEEALQQVDEHKNEIEAIVLDLMMPGVLDGYGVCDRLSEKPSTKAIPVIVLSAKTSTRDMARSYAAGAVQHLTKPYDIKHLLAVVASMVRLYRAEQESVATAEKYKVILDNSPAEMLLLDTGMRIVEMNRTFREAFPDARIGDSPLDAIYDDPPEDLDNHPVYKALAAGEPADAVVEGASKGKTVYRRVHAVPLKKADGEVRAIVDITEDVTDRVEMEERLRRQIERHNRAIQQQDMMAEGLMTIQRQLRQKNKELEDAKVLLEKLSITDDLTGLFNKRHFNEIIVHEARRSSRYEHPLSLLIMDIDHFKEVNDTYGHPAGNVVLQDLGKILLNQLRDTDAVVRYGGEEFVAVLPETDQATSERIGERLRGAVEDHVFTLPDKTHIRCTISVGSASEHSKTVDGERLLARADEALYEAKRGGRNRVCIAPPG